MISGQQEKKTVSKTVLITGGAGGIGREFSKLFARDGYRVVVFSLLQQELDELGGLLRQENPRCEYLPVQMDLSEPDAAQRIHDWLKAQRINLDFRRGQRVQVSTANGVAIGHVVRLDSVRVGDAQVFGVSAIVLPQPMPYVLLGNTFLTRFQMQRNNDQLTLERRY